MKELENKHILFISPKFFSYETIIKSTLETEYNAHVDFFDERPSNDFFTKLFIRLRMHKFLKRKIEQYYRTIFQSIENNTYDFFFCITPETLSIKHIKTLRQLNPNAIFILYMWDSFKNKDCKKIIHMFDKIITFDPDDAKTYNINFCPLFYTENYYKIHASENQIQFDLCSIATAHSDRYAIITALKKNIQNDSLKFFNFLYLNNKLIYWIRHIFLKSYRYGPISDFSFSPLSPEEVLFIITQSNAVLDINHPSQVGLTIRTFEALGAKRKLITTNKNIEQYDFYNSNNITIIDRKNPQIDLNFFKTSYSLLNNKIYEKYSLTNWIKNIFSTTSTTKY